MSFLAKLKIDNEEVNILKCDFGFKQEIDKSGKPLEVAKGGTICLEIESTSDTNLLSWMVSHTETRNGSIIFYRRDAMSRMKELKFSKAYCVDYHEYFEADNKKPMRTVLVLSCKEMSLGAVNYANSWSFFN